MIGESGQAGQAGGQAGQDSGQGVDRPDSLVRITWLTNGKKFYSKDWHNREFAEWFIEQRNKAPCPKVKWGFE